MDPSEGAVGMQVDGDSEPQTRFLSLGPEGTADEDESFYPMTPVELHSPVPPTAHATWRKASRPESPTTSAWIETFLTMTSHAQSTALSALVDALNERHELLPHLMHLHNAVKPLLRRDFIAHLPEEISLLILSYLDAKDLCVAACVSRTWAYLAEKDRLWQNICRREYDVTTLLPAILRDGFTSSPPAPQGSIGWAVPLSPPHTWKHVYVTKRRVECAWEYLPLEAPKTLLAHQGDVITCLMVTEGGRVISGSNDGTLKLWATAKGQCLRTLTGHAGGVWCCDINGDYCVSGSTDRSLRLWHMGSARCLFVFNGHHSTVRCVKFMTNAPDAPEDQRGRIVSGSRDGTLRVWNTADGALLRVLQGHDDAVRCVETCARLIVSGSYDSTVRVWCSETYNCLHVLQGHDNRVYSLQIGPLLNNEGDPMGDAMIAVSGSLDTTIRVWNLQTGTCLHRLTGHQSLNGLLCLRGRLLVSGNADNTLRIWDVVNGECLRVLLGHTSAVTGLSLVGDFITSCADDGTVRLWSIKTGQLLRNLVTLTGENALQGGPGAAGVVWMVATTMTQLVCAVGRRDNNPDSSRLVIVDFLDAANKAFL